MNDEEPDAHKWQAAANILGQPMYYQRDGTPIPRSKIFDDVMEWARDFEKGNAIAHDTSIWGDEISTVFLGLDHNWSPTGPPLIYETMVFRKASDDKRRGDECYQEQCSTEDEARHIHEHVRAQCRFPLWIRKRLFSGWY
jgi:hypothetical protein